LLEASLATTATENAEQIALLEASVATSTAKITTLEKRLSKRDATIERLKREKDERNIWDIPSPPGPEPVPEPPAAALVEVVEDAVVIEEDTVSNAAPGGDEAEVEAEEQDGAETFRSTHTTLSATLARKVGPKTRCGRKSARSRLSSLCLSSAS
jgi:hypothetical protein